MRTAISALIVLLLVTGVAMGGPKSSPVGGGKTVVCHYPPGNTDNPQTIRVGSQQSVDAHLGHGDSCGPCE